MVRQCYMFMSVCIWSSILKENKNKKKTKKKQKKNNRKLVKIDVSAALN